MIFRAQVDQLHEFQSGDYLVTSCYLDLDQAKQPPQLLKIRVNDLLQSAQQELSTKAGSPALCESLRADFEFIGNYARQEIFTNRHKGLAIFSCAAHKFWQAYGLPRFTRNILVADLAPYVRPLAVVLGEYRRFCAVVLDASGGQLFEVYMGEIIERTDLLDAEPRRTTEGGPAGRDERTVHHHDDPAVHQHYQRLADATFKMFKRDKCDFLVLGGLTELLADFKERLHPDLRAHLAGEFHAKPFTTPPEEVLTRVREIEDRVERESEEQMAEELVQQAGTGMGAVSGVMSTLDAIARGEAQTLLVEDGFETPGYQCASCHHISLNNGDCPICQAPLQPCRDIIDEAIELALEKDCRIQRVRTATALRDAGRMGALLRFQT
jgi:hypothetical protein